MRIRDKIFIIANRTAVISAVLFVFWLFFRTDDTLNILASIDLMVFAIAATLVFAMWEDCT